MKEKYDFLKIEWNGVIKMLNRLGSFLESYERYRNLMIDFENRTTPKDYGEYLARKGKKKRKRAKRK